MQVSLNVAGEALKLLGAETHGLVSYAYEALC